MLRILLALLLLPLAARAQFPDINGQTSGNLPSTRLRFNYEIAGLPAAALNTNVVALVTNGSAAANDCSTVGTDEVWCYSNGTNWVAVSGGGGGGGETNTASSNGAGVSLYATKVASDLQFNSLVSQSTGALTVTLDDPNDEIDFTVDAELVALAGIATPGMLSRTGAGTAAARTITGDSEIVVTNGDGVSGNPTLSIAASLTRDAEAAAAYQGIDADLTSFAALATTGGAAYRTAADTWTLRSIVGTANQLTVTNGDGVSGAPMLSIPSTFYFPGTARLDNNTALLGRNFADSADVTILRVNASDEVEFPNGLRTGTSGQGLMTLLEGAALSAPSTAGEHRLGFVTTESRLCSIENGGSQQCYALTSETGGGGGGTLGGSNDETTFTSQTSVVVDNPFGHDRVMVKCYDGSENELLYESAIVGSTPFDVTVSFTVAQSGRCVISGGGAGTHEESITAQTSVTVLASTHNLGTAPTFNGCFDGSGNQQTPDDWSRNGSGDVTLDFLVAFTGDCYLGQ